MAVNLVASAADRDILIVGSGDTVRGLRLASGREEDLSSQVHQELSDCKPQGESKFSGLGLDEIWSGWIETEELRGGGAAFGANFQVENGKSRVQPEEAKAKTRRGQSGSGEMLRHHAILFHLPPSLSLFLSPCQPWLRKVTTPLI